MANQKILLRVNVGEETLLGKLAKINEAARELERMTSDMMYELTGEHEKAAEFIEESAAGHN